MGLDGLRPVRHENKEFSGSFQRKLDKKQHFYDKVKNAIVSLAAKKVIGKKKKPSRRQRKAKAYDLSSLAEFLPEFNTSTSRLPPPASNLKLNCKSRQNIVEKESKQLATVLSHPEFQLDPIAAIHRHLEATLSREIGSQGKPSAKRGQKKEVMKNSQKKGAAKRKKSKASVTTQSMEF